MAWYTADGTLLEVLEEGVDGDEWENPKDTQQGEEAGHGGVGNGQDSGCGKAPLHVRGCGGMGGLGSGRGYSSLRDYDPDLPWPPNILDQLVAALHDTGLQANPWHLCRHRLDIKYPGCRNPQGIGNDKSDDGEDDGPHVKIPPLIFKGLPREWPDVHLLASEDQMETMCFGADDYIDKFKHAL